MVQGAQKLRKAARQSLARIRRDRENAPEDLKPLLRFLEEHLFELTTNVKRLHELYPGPDPVRRLQKLLGAPHAYIEDRRLETARRLLDEPRLKVREVAELVGYSSVQVFSRAFRRWSGERPTVFRDRDRSAVRVPAARLDASLDPEEVSSIRAEEIWRALADRSPAAQLELVEQLRLDDASLVDLLRRRCRRRIRENPEDAVHLARLALAAAETLCGEKERARQKALCWAELANACREARDLDEAGRAMAVAEAWIAGVPLPEPARCRFLTLKATLQRDQGRLSTARATIDEALEAARRAQDEDLYAEALIAKASILSRAGDPTGIALLEEALSLGREAGE